VPIGLRTVLIEWAGWRSRGRDLALVCFSIFLLYFGMRAVTAVFR
jgi:fumarate reductase subunit C